MEPLVMLFFITSFAGEAYFSKTSKMDSYVQHPSSCEPIKNGTLEYTKYKVHRQSKVLRPVVETKYVVRKDRGNYFSSKTSTVLLQIVRDPGRTFSVLEPIGPGSCMNGSGKLAKVRVSAQQKDCILATSGGFFNLHSGECYGNIFSDGRLVRNAGGVQSVHFGVTEDGFIFVGYLSEEDLYRHKFKQLIGGLLWVIRDGKSYLEESIKRECPFIAETGNLSHYPRVDSARLILGHDKSGRILIFQSNGKTKYFGLDLYNTIPILLDLGFVNAINLDSGSSTTVIVNGTVVNHPTYPCKNDKFACERAVSTILCVHNPDRQKEEHSSYLNQPVQNGPQRKNSLEDYDEDSPAQLSSATFNRVWIHGIVYDILFTVSITTNVVLLLLYLSNCLKVNFGKSNVAHLKICNDKKD